MKKKFLTFLETPLGKGLVTLLRNAVIVFAGVVIDGLIDLIPGIDLEPSTKIAVIAALKIIDETLHKTGLAVKGLTRF